MMLQPLKVGVYCFGSAAIPLRPPISTVIITFQAMKPGG